MWSAAGDEEIVDGKEEESKEEEELVTAGRKDSSTQCVSPYWVVWNRTKQWCVSIMFLFVFVFAFLRGCFRCVGGCP